MVGLVVSMGFLFIVGLIIMFSGHFLIGLAFCAIAGCAIWLLNEKSKEGAKDNQHTNNKDKKNIVKVVIVVGIIILLIITVASGAFNSKSGGDGKTTCKNCGRNTSLVPGYGYCSNCYKGFIDWQSKD